MTSSRVVDIILTAFFGILGIAALIMVADFPFRDALFPWVASLMIIFFAIGYGGIIVRGLRSTTVGNREHDSGPSDDRVADGIPGVQKGIRIVHRLFGFIFL